MNEKIFEQLKEEYNKMQTTYQLYIDLYKKKAVRKCFNKGYLLDILPFEHEMFGYKLHKKPLQKMVMENNHFVYHFNAEDQVCLVERACTFLKQIEYYTLYDYHENYLYKYELQKSEFKNVGQYFMENGKVVEGYIYAKYGHRYEQYVYSGERLEKMLNTHFDHEQEETSHWETHFYYNQKEKLKLIQEVYENGYTVNRYADIKLNYNKLKARLYETFKEKIELFFSQHSSEKIETMGLRLWMDDLAPMLDINFRASGDKEISVAEWSYSAVADIDLVDVPLESAQQDKIVQTVYAVLIELIDHQIIPEGMKLKVFYHDENEIGLERKAIQKMVKGREKFFRK